MLAQMYTHNIPKIPRFFVIAITLHKKILVKNPIHIKILVKQGIIMSSAKKITKPVFSI